MIIIIVIIIIIIIIIIAKPSILMGRVGNSFDSPIENIMASSD